MPRDTLQRDDVVQFNKLYHTPTMLVISDEQNGVVTCAWWDKNWCFHEKYFRVEDLNLVKVNANKAA